MKVQDILNCSFDAWFPAFSKVTFPSRIIPIPGPVLDYLRSDGGLVLPKECDTDQPDTEDGGFSDEDDGDDAERPTFPDFCALVRREIDDLGGAVLSKLNWSSPRDAAWMGVGRSLKCTNLSEVLLLLKSSDFVTHDLTQAFDDCEDVEESVQENMKYFLVLRKWSSSINPGYEFRCFVVDRILVGISQRDATQFHKHILDEKDSILRDIKSFFQEHIQNKFQSKNYVFDVYRRKKDSVKLVDFNPFGPTTDSQLFDWEEDLLKTKDPVDEVDFRFIESQNGIQPDGLGQFSMPRDFVDLAAGTDPEKLADFLKLQGSIQDKEDANSSS